MTMKTFFITTAIVMTAWMFWSGIFSFRFEKKGDRVSQIVLKYDKGSVGAVAVSRLFHQTGRTLLNLTEPLFVNCGGPALLQRVKDEPVIFGGLFIFAGVSMCGIGYIVHMVRHDARI